MNAPEKDRRRRKAALNRTTDAAPVLPLMFNIDDEGHRYQADLLDLAEDNQ